MGRIFTIVISYFKGYITLVTCALCFIAGVAFTALFYRHEIAQMKLEQTDALAAQVRKNEERLKNATNTILLAQSEYDAVKSERDALIDRLRQLNEVSLRESASSRDALARRAAACEKLAEQLLDASQRCGDGWQRCATKHDALIQLHK